MVLARGRTRQVFIFCWFLVWLIAAVSVAVTSLPIAPPLALAGAALMVTEAMCILFYGLALRSKRWRWLARGVPLLFVLAYVADWAYAGGLPKDEPFDSAALMAAAAGFVTFWVLLYFLLRYGYSPKLPPDSFSIPVMLIALLGAGFLSFIENVPVFAPRIRVTHNYLPELNDLTRPIPYDAAENAALEYALLADRVGPMPEDVNRVRDLWPDDMDEAGRRAVRAWVTSDPGVLEELMIAARKSQYWIERHEPNGRLMHAAIPEGPGLRTLVFYLLLHAKLDACEKNVGAAVEEILTGYAMGTQLAGPRFALEQLIGMGICNLSAKSAFEVLSKVHLDSTLMKRLQDSLHDSSTRWDHGFDFSADRLMALDEIQRTFSDDGAGGGCISRRRSWRLGWGWVHIDRAGTVRLLEDCFASLAVEARMTPWQCRIQGLNTKDAWERENSPAVAYDVISASIGIRLCWRLRTHTAALITTLAIFRYRADAGYLPTSLDELVPAGYLHAVPMDPFGDGPLVYRHQDGDFILYSRGLDFDDDGGVPSKWGEGDAGGDQVFWPVESSSGKNH